MRQHGINVAIRRAPTCYASKDEWIDDRGDDRGSSRTRFTEESKEARELQDLRYERDDDDDDKVQIVQNDYYYEDDDDVEYMEEDEDYIYEDEEEEDEATGNFWYNPKQSTDPLPAERPPRRRRTSKLEEETDVHPERRPRPRRGSPRRKYVIALLVHCS